MAAILSGLPAVTLHFVAFSTEVIDRSERVDDPLGEAATHAERTLQGTRARADALELARTWLSATVYERAARRTLARAGW